MQNNLSETKQPLVSVVMPAYNCEKYIAEAIESVQKQTYTQWELLIINDCSTDNTRMLADRYAKADSRIRILDNEANSGVAKTRNHGITQAQGAYIALLDGDDVWCAEKLEKQIECLQKSHAEFCYCSYDFINKTGLPCGKPFVVPQTTTFEQMLVRNVVGCSTVVISSKILKAHLFSSEFYHEDYALWMELFQERIPVCGIVEVLCHYRRIETSRSANKLHAAKQRWKIYREKLRLPLCKSIVCFLCYAIKGTKKHYW